jgi:hypothetical protein
MGERQNGPFQLSFNASLKVDAQHPIREFKMDILHVFALDRSRKWRFPIRRKGETHMRYILIAAFLTSTLAAQQLPDAAALIKESDTARRSFRSLQYTMDITTEATGEGQHVPPQLEMERAFYR